MASSIHQEVTLKATPKRIYQALMSSKEHAAFTANGACKIGRKVGEAISCHGGYVTGRNVELVPGRRIVQAWRFRGWPRGLYTIVKFELKKTRGGTRLVLDHTGIPPKDVGHLTSGWKARYWKPLRKYLAQN